MPHTAYGLLKAIRSHTIDSADIAVNVRSGRPNACNLCHLDRTLDWTAQQLEEWYAIERPELTPDQETVSGAALWALQGDAGQRVLTAWHMGWKAAVDASGEDWLPPYLATLLDDPYPAVRFNAVRSLRRMIAFESFDYDYTGAADDRKAAVGRALQVWRNQRRTTAAPPHQNAGQLLLNRDGSLQQDTFDRLREHRDDKPVRLAE